VPGMTEPINLPRAHIQVAGSRITADPVVAVLGTSVFTGRFAHKGDRTQPWEFDLQANTLSLEQGSLWFDALGRRQPIPLLERLPGLSSFGARRVAASNLFGALNARGHFSSPTVTYGTLNLDDFDTSVEISGRILRLVGATFRAGSGRGQGQAVVDLTTAPARVALDVAMTDGNLQSLAGRLPVELRKVRGTYSGTGHFETRGLSHEEMTSNLQGSATVRAKNVLLGEFDPLQAVARETGWGTIEPVRGEMGIKASALTLGVHDRRVVLGNTPVELGGAKLTLTGDYNFDGALDLNVRADMRHIKRRWLNTGDEGEPSARTIDIHMAGPLGKLAVVPGIAAAQASPGRRAR
jgi:AsmA-like C-terminal region